MSRRSSGLGELSRSFDSPDPLCILDLGATSANNIRYFTGRTHKIYSEDLLLASVDPSLRIKDEEGKPVIDTKRFLEENLAYSAAHFDIVFAWNLPDYLDEELVKPVIDRLWSALKPGGMLLAFFHTRDAGPDAPCYRFHITGNDTLDMCIGVRLKGRSTALRLSSCTLNLRLARGCFVTVENLPYGLHSS